MRLKYLAKTYLFRILFNYGFFKNDPRYRYIKLIRRWTFNTSIDIGSNIGQFLNVLSKNSKKVLAIEPQPDLNKSIKWVYGNLRNVIIDDNIIKNKDIEMMSLENYGGTIGTYRTIDGNRKALSLTDALKIYDIQFRSIDFIKIDIEGGEDYIIENDIIPNIIERGVHPVILAEIGYGNKQRIVKLLSEYGYKAHAIRAGRLCAAPITEVKGYEDTLFARF